MSVSTISRKTSSLPVHSDGCSERNSKTPAECQPDLADSQLADSQFLLQMKSLEKAPLHDGIFLWLSTTISLLIGVGLSIVLNIPVSYLLIPALLVPVGFTLLGIRHWLSQTALFLTSLMVLYTGIKVCSSGTSFGLESYHLTEIERRLFVLGSLCFVSVWAMTYCFRRVLISDRKKKFGTVTTMSDRETSAEKPGGTSDAVDTHLVSVPMVSVPNEWPEAMLSSQRQIVNLLSGTLEPLVLYPLIQRTAEKILTARGCYLYLWNQRDQRASLADTRTTATQPRFNLEKESFILSWLFKFREVLTQAEIQNDQSFSLLTHHGFIPSAILPISLREEVLGFLVVEEILKADGDSSVSFSQQHKLELLSHQIALSLKNSMLYSDVLQLARKDGLTGLLNHVSFRDELREQIVECSLGRIPLSLMMSDIDYFKALNDQFGHPAGDFVLQEIANIWRSVMPANSVLARYGGEEFVGIVPGVALEEAARFAESLRRSIALKDFYFEGKHLEVTASFGVTALDAPAETLEELIRVADLALYEAKRKGRNLVICYEPTLPT